MPCYHPLDGRRTPGGRIVFRAATPFDKLIKLPCGRCIGCKLERSRQWAVRLMHEAQLHEKKSFITLTKDNAHLTHGGAASQSLSAPPTTVTEAANSDTHARAIAAYAHEERAASLDRRELQLFTKRLNESVRRSSAKGVRYFACGEYGERLGRPHYHLAVYGEDFSDDRYEWRTNGANKLYRSSRLEQLWPFGHAEIGELTFDSAAYIARYITKKITGAKAHDHYMRTAPDGTNYWLEPEFSVMSRRPGIGKAWIDRYLSDAYPHDYVVVRGHKAKPPRFYDQAHEAINPTAHELIKQARENAAKKNSGENTPERLRTRETVAIAALNLKKRSL